MNGPERFRIAFACDCWWERLNQMSYSSELGRWVQQDPAGYVDGASRYQALSSSPTTMLDPDGLQASAGAIGGGTTQMIGGPKGSAAPTTQPNPLWFNRYDLLCLDPLTPRILPGARSDEMR